MSVYINGALKYVTYGDCGSTTGIASKVEQWILGSDCGANSGFLGNLDEFRVYNFALGMNDVTSLFSSWFGQRQRFGMANFFIGIFGTPPSWTVASVYPKGQDSAYGATCQIASPFGIASTPDGTKAYVVGSQQSIVQVDLKTTKCVVVAGSYTGAGAASTVPVDGVGAAAKFTAPYGIVITPDGTTAYISEIRSSLITYCRIRKMVLSTFTVSTVVGGSTCSVSSYSTGTAATLQNPTDMVITPSGAFMYVIERTTCAVVKVSLSTYATSMALGSSLTAPVCCSSGATCTITSAWPIMGLQGLAMSPDGTILYLADTTGNRIFSWTIGTGSVGSWGLTFLAGNSAGSATARFGEGFSSSVGMMSPFGMAVSSDGNWLYYSEMSVLNVGGNKVRRLSLTSTPIMSHYVAGSILGTQMATSATLASPTATTGVWDGSDGNNVWFINPAKMAISNNYLYVTESDGNRVRRLDLSLLPKTVSIDDPAVRFSFDNTLADSVGRTALNVYYVPTTATQTFWAESAMAYVDVMKGYTLYMDATQSQRVYFPNPMGNQFSLSFFFKPLSTSASQGLFGLCSGNNFVTTMYNTPPYYGLRAVIVASTSPSPYVQLGAYTTSTTATVVNSYTTAGAPAVSTTAYNHLVVIAFGNTITMYLNGVSVGTITGTAGTTNTGTATIPNTNTDAQVKTWLFGNVCDISTITNTFKGYIDDIRLYDYPLSSSEVTALYNAYTYTPSPSSAPTPTPSTFPTPKPSSTPTLAPTAKPSGVPTPKPSSYPTTGPSPQPTAFPTLRPTFSWETSEPTAPSAEPTLYPTAEPTPDPPTPEPTPKPSSRPTIVPSPRPTTPMPSALSTTKPTTDPSSLPTVEPTPEPSSLPSVQPSAAPTAEPTVEPTADPTAPSPEPSASPSTEPTPSPSARPTFVPSEEPTALPTVKPTPAPSAEPTTRPTQPTALPTTRPTAQPTLVPTRKPTPEPTPLYLGAPQFMYRTYHVGAGCSSAVRVYDFSPLNTCIAPTEDTPYFHLEFCSVEDSPSGDYNITQLRYEGNAALKCSGSHSFHKFDRGHLCRKRSNLWVRTHCGLPVLDAVVNREQIILSSYRTNSCSGQSMQRGVILNGCQPVKDPIVGRGTEYHSRLTYNGALSDNSTDTLFLSDSYYRRKDCSGSPVKVVEVQYPKGIYTSARQRKQCYKDELRSGFVASATYVESLTTAPTPTPGVSNDGHNR